MWHKAVLLISAAPITVFMNSVRIALAGYIVNTYGVDWVDGFTHFFEGWVIFVSCVLLLFLLARIMLFFHPSKMGLAEALDLEVDGLATQAARIRLVQPSPALITAALMMVTAALAWQALPERGAAMIEREPFALFPRQIGDWRQVGAADILEDEVARTLKADDYHSVDLADPDAAAAVGLFIAWYADQSKGGIHPPEVCLPSSGWEIAWLERVDVADDLGAVTPFNINRAIIQKGETRMMVFYWFDQRGRKVAWDMAAKFWLMINGISSGRTDGALVRLTTLITAGESDADAAARLMDVLRPLQEVLPRFIPNE